MFTLFQPVLYSRTTKTYESDITNFGCNITPLCWDKMECAIVGAIYWYSNRDIFTPDFVNLSTEFTKCIGEVFIRAIMGNLLPFPFRTLVNYLLSFVLKTKQIFHE